MSAPYTVATQALTYTVIDDNVILYEACVTGGLIDEASGTPLGTSLNVAPSVSVDVPGIVVNLSSGGLFALVCYTDLVFPKLATIAYTLTLTIVVPNYRTRIHTVFIPAGTVLPFALPSPVAMRASTVRLQGRVVADVSRAPIAGATVDVTTANIAALRTPAYFDHAAGVAIAAITVTPSGAPTKLANAVIGASNLVTVASTAGIAGGQVIQIGPDINADLAVVSTIDSTSGNLGLVNAINSSFPVGASVQPVTVTPTGPSSTLARDVNAGDGLLLLTGPLVNPLVEITDGAATEYHLTAAQTAADGYYHLNGIGGVVTIDLTAQAGGFTNLTQPLAVSYSTNALNVVDFRLQP
jgi:hypothetical protein